MPSVYQQARAYQSAVESLLDDALRLMAQELARSLPALVSQAEAAAYRLAAMRAAGVEPSTLQLFAVQRSRAIAQQVAAEIDRVMAALTVPLDAAQQAAMVQGLEAARALVEVQLPAGARLGSWQTANMQAVIAAIGAQQGAPLGTLLDALGKDAGRLVRDKLNAGLLAGKSPRVIARGLREVAALSATRAMVLARNETLRAFRVASLTAYQQNGVTRYRRLAAKSARTCVICLALDGQEQDTGQMMAVHVQDRCTVIPIVTIPGATQPPARENGEDWFAKQDEAIQRRVLGPGGLKLYESGTPLSAFVRVHDDPVWGPTLERRRLSEVA